MLNPNETLLDLYAAEEWDILLAALGHVETVEKLPLDDLLGIYDDTEIEVIKATISQILLVRLFEIGPELIRMYIETTSWKLQALIIALFCQRLTPRFFPFIVTEYLMTPPFREYIEKNAFSDPTATLLGLAQYLETSPPLNAQQETILMALLNKIPETVYAQNAADLRFLKIADLYRLARTRHLPKPSSPPSAPQVSR